MRCIRLFQWSYCVNFWVRNWANTRYLFYLQQLNVSLIFIASYNFDPGLGKNEKKSVNSIDLCSITLFAKHYQFSISKSWVFRSVCGRARYIRIVVYLSSTHLSCFNAFCLSCSIMKLRLKSLNLIVLWVSRKILGKQAPHWMLAPFVWNTHLYLHGKCKWWMTLVKLKPWLFHAQSMFLTCHWREAR